jgi:hypothetical protein
MPLSKNHFQNISPHPPSLFACIPVRNRAMPLTLSLPLTRYYPASLASRQRTVSTSDKDPSRAVSSSSHTVTTSPKRLEGVTSIDN